MKKVILVLFVCFALSSSSLQQFEVKKIPQATVNQYLNKKLYEDEYNRYKSNAFSAVKFLPKNYAKDGSVDYTAYLQKALMDYDVVLLPNFPIKISDKGLNLKSKQVLLFQPESKLLLKPTARADYNMLSLSNIRDVKIFYANMEGDRYDHLGKRGQWGFGISIKSCKNIKIYCPYLKNMWGDGIYIGQLNNILSDNIVVENAVINNARRNGISITSANGVYIKGGYIANTNGNSPESGLDIEPNTPQDVIKNINIQNLTTFNNKWSGILMVFEKFKGKDAKSISVNIDGHIDNFSRKAIAFHGYLNDSQSNNMSGTIRLSNTKYSNNQEKYFFYKTNLARLKIETVDSDLKKKFSSYNKR